MNILTNFEESREELIKGTAKREQINWSNIFGMLLLPRLYQDLNGLIVPFLHVGIDYGLLQTTHAEITSTKYTDTDANFISKITQSVSVYQRQGI